MSSFRLAAVGLVVLLLGACGFEPIYGGSRGGEMSAELATIRIDPIKDRIGQLLRNDLLDTLSPLGATANPKYRLIVDVEESREELAVQKSELATRANMNFTATYRLVPINSDSPILTRSSLVTASYNLINNDFANLAAEANGRERGMRELSEDIARQLTLYFRAQAKAAQR